MRVVKRKVINQVCVDLEDIITRIAICVAIHCTQLLAVESLDTPKMRASTTPCSFLIVAIFCWLIDLLSFCVWLVYLVKCAL